MQCWIVLHSVSNKCFPASSRACRDHEGATLDQKVFVLWHLLEDGHRSCYFFPPEILLWRQVHSILASSAWIIVQSWAAAETNQVTGSWTGGWERKVPGINEAPVAIGRGRRRCKQLQEAIAGREKSVLSMAAICGRDLWKSGIQVSVFSPLIKKP